MGELVRKQRGGSHGIAPGGCFWVLNIVLYCQKHPRLNHVEYLDSGD